MINYTHGTLHCSCKLERMAIAVNFPISASKYATLKASVVGPSLHEGSQEFAFRTCWEVSASCPCNT